MIYLAARNDRACRIAAACIRPEASACGLVFCACAYIMSLCVVSLPRTNVCCLLQERRTEIDCGPLINFAPDFERSRVAPAICIILSRYCVIRGLFAMTLMLGIFSLIRWSKRRRHSDSTQQPCAHNYGTVENLRRNDDAENALERVHFAICTSF